MGWFKSKSGGMIGDDPLDIIEGAIKRYSNHTRKNGKEKRQ